MVRDVGHVVVACDKFGGTLTSQQAAEAIRRGLAAAGRTVRIVPVADGGDGTVAAALRAGFTPVPVAVRGPTHLPLRTAYAVRGTRAVIELADACGLSRLPDGALEPLRSSSHGLGDVIAAAVRAGYRDLLVGLGGSASSDGGAGMLAALGATTYTASGDEIRPGGGELIWADRLDLGGLLPELARTSVVIAADVDNPLLGQAGAVAVYGRQKGVISAGVADRLERGLANWADVVDAALGTQVGVWSDRPHPDPRNAAGAGAAGGVGFAALAVLGASLRPGIEAVLDLSGRDVFTGAALVIAGEGRVDGQTLRGKAAMGVARAAHAAGAPCVVVCGQRDLTEVEARSAGFAQVAALTDLEADVRVCQAQAGPLLARLVQGVAERWLEAPQ